MVAVELLNLRIVTFPGRSSRGVMIAVALAQTAVLLANGRKTAGFAPLVHRITDPVDTRVAADLQRIKASLGREGEIGRQDNVPPCG